MNAVAYMRWSTADQDLSPLAQRDAIEKWAAHEKVAIVAWHQDAAISGGLGIDKRPGLFAALEQVGPGVNLVVAKRDRLARDVMVACLIQKMAKDRGATVLTADGAGNGTEPTDVLMRQILDVFAEYERVVIRLRTGNGHRAKKARGGRVGTIPIGYLEPVEGAAMVRGGPEAAASDRAVELRASGMTLRAIGAALSAEGHAPRGKAWHPQSVKAALRRTA